jgi:hypothetical protein
MVLVDFLLLVVSLYVFMDAFDRACVTSKHGSLFLTSVHRSGAFVLSCQCKTIQQQQQQHLRDPKPSITLRTMMSIVFV